MCAKSNQAFTAVELLGATALLTLLMFAVLSVIGALGRTRTLLDHAEEQRSAGESDWSAALVELLRSDLTHATEVRMDRAKGTLTIGGFAALDRTTRRRSHDPVAVTYALVPLDSAGLPASSVPLRATSRLDPGSAFGATSGGELASGRLVRTQVNLTEPSNKNTWSELVCDGISNFRLLIIRSLPPEEPLEEPSEEESTVDSDHGGRSDEAHLLDRGLLPQRVRLIVEWADPNSPKLDRILQIR